MKIVKIGDIYVNPSRVAYVKEEWNPAFTLISFDSLAADSDGDTYEQHVSVRVPLETVVMLLNRGLSSAPSPANGQQMAGK